MRPTVKSGLMLLFALLAFSGLQASAAWAASDDHKNYGRVGLGINQFTGDLDDAGYNEGLATYVTYGRYLVKYLPVEATFSFFGTDEDFSGSTGVAGAYSREDTLLVSSFLVTLKGEIPMGPVRLYGGGGFGVYFADLESEIETVNLGDFDVDEQDTVFGAHVVVGGSYDITQRIFAGIEGVYRWTGDLDLDETTGTVPVQINDDLDGFTVSLWGGFRF
ncbi:MAG: outer membrane beta-barrel protein [Desulfobacteraceae bacterium]